jgi:hypothetical protein
MTSFEKKPNEKKKDKKKENTTNICVQTKQKKENRLLYVSDFRYSITRKGITMQFGSLTLPTADQLIEPKVSKFMSTCCFVVVVVVVVV